MEQMPLIKQPRDGKKLLRFLSQNAVVLIAFLLALITCAIVKPDRAYLDYFDIKTLTCLFCMMLVLCGLRNIFFFRILAKKIVSLFRNTRAGIAALVFITYFASMLIANDMALITFLPLGLIVLKATGKERFMIVTFILQNIAANLGGMLTPFGNPQNLFLYNYFSIPTGEFFAIMLIPTLVAVALVIGCCLFVKKEAWLLDSKAYDYRLDMPRAIVYGVLFVYSILIVFRAVPFWTGFLMVPLMLIFDRRAIVQVDYGLLLTFCLFFVITGNLGRIEPVRVFLSWLTGKSTLLTGVFSCQLISNVPSAVLLSGFTANYRDLLMAVNIGGCGTLISSLASLITFKQFIAERKGETVKYLVWFHIANFGFLAVLTAICIFL